VLPHGLLGARIAARRNDKNTRVTREKNARNLKAFLI
jgi:hypothetical protein